MQKLVIEAPYRFVTPYRRTIWSELFRPILPYYLRATHGIVDVECRNLDRLKASVREGKGVLLAPNHCRLSDPMTMGAIVRETGIHTYTMASWHLFNQDGFGGRLSAWMMRRLGAFSILREGVDRTALTTAVDVLAAAERPLILYPEGVVSRANDRLGPLMDGTAFIARMAARKAAKEGRPGVVVHPVTLRYVFLGDVERAVDPFLTELETRLTWRPRTGRPGIERVADLSRALLAMKEVEYLEHAVAGDPHERRLALIEHILRPLEVEWFDKPSDDPSVVGRVKEIRTAILPKLLESDLPAAERRRLRDQLWDVYLAQQLSFHAEGYLFPGAPPERLLEAVERLEEDVTDAVRIYGRFKVLLDVGEAIPVSAERDKRAGRGEPDPLLAAVGESLREMLDASAREVAASRQTTVPEHVVEQPERVHAGM